MRRERLWGPSSFVFTVRFSPGVKQSGRYINGKKNFTWRIIDKKIVCAHTLIYFTARGSSVYGQLHKAKKRGSTSWKPKKYANTIYFCEIWSSLGVVVHNFSLLEYEDVLTVKELPCFEWLHTFIFTLWRVREDCLIVKASELQPNETWSVIQWSKLCNIS